MLHKLLLCGAAAVVLTTSMATHTASAQQNVVILLDDSGSMDQRMRSQGRTRRIDAAKQALVGVLSSLPEDTNVGVLALNSRLNESSWIVPLGPLADSSWKRNLAQVDAMGGTPLGEQLKVAADALLDARSKQVYGTYRLLVVTDGEANDPQLVDSFLPQILARGVTVDAIGVDMASDHSLATRVHHYRRADDNSSLEQAISEVFAETSFDDQDADADFELLEGLPDEFASEALAALTTVSNEPIGQAPADSIAESESGYTEPSGSSGEVSSIVALGMMGCCCFGSFIVLGGLIFVLVKATSRRRK